MPAAGRVASRASIAGGSSKPSNASISRPRTSGAPRGPAAVAAPPSAASTVTPSALERAGEPADEPALERDEEDEDREDGHRHAGRDRAEIGGEGALQRGEPDGQRLVRH